MTSMIMRLSSLIECLKGIIDLEDIADQLKSSSHYSISCNSKCILRIMDKLIDQGQHLNIQDDYGNTPLHYALQLKCGDDSIIRYIESGADVNCSNYSGYTPLNYALNFDHGKKVIFKILDSGAKVDVQDELGMTPLMCAIMNKAQREVLLRLLYATSDINCMDRFGNTALICALLVNRFDKDIICRLIGLGADTTGIDEEGNTILHKASGSTWTCISTFIFNRGISINGRNKNGETPLFLAAKYYDLDKVETLLALGCKPNISDNNKRTPLHAACGANTINLLVYYGGDLQAKDSFGFTPLDLHLKIWNHENVFCIIKHYLLRFEKIKIHKSVDKEEGLEGSLVFDKHLKPFSEELSEMKVCNITKNLSFHRFCNLKITKRHKFLISNSEYICNSEEIYEKFPNFFDLIHWIMAKNEIEKKRYNLVQKFSQISIRPYLNFSCEYGEQLNFDCLENICHYLTHKELFNVFLASL